MMKDWLGNDLMPGDKVIYIHSYGRSEGNFTKAIVKGFTNTYVVFEGGKKKSPEKVLRYNW